MKVELTQTEIEEMILSLENDCLERLTYVLTGEITTEECEKWNNDAHTTIAKLEGARHGN